MKHLLQWQGISRQGAHKAIRALGKDNLALLQTLELAADVREDHPQMGCRDIYYAMRESMPRGRDWSEVMLLNHGFRVKTPTRSFTRAGDLVCANLIEGITLTGPNQLWQTDITYVWVDRRWFYVSFVVDVYTRNIVASHCSKDLSSRNQIACLGKALAGVAAQDRTNLIVHTDRGCQYTSTEFKGFLKRNAITQSMAHYAWQNAYCERVNRSIKHGYLAHYNLQNFASLQFYLRKAVHHYNSGKPHRCLPGRLSPNQFVKDLNQGLHSNYTVRIWSKLTSTKFLHSN
jgi:putative transposase